MKLIEDAIAALKKEYVFPAVVDKIAKRLRDAIPRYEKIKSLEKLAKLVTEDMRAISRDKHLAMVWSAEPLPPDAPDANILTPTQRGELVAHAARFNAAFVKVERLAGNIGYVRLDAFLPPLVSASAAAAAMSFVADTDELVIDLRHNGGGSPECVALLVSYLYDAGDRQHINDIWRRRDDTTEQFWTFGDLAGRRYAGKPVYVLTSARTFSAAEDFAYGVRMLGRAKLVGEVTGGGAHPSVPRRLTPHIAVIVPFGRSINPISKTNWEGTGVKPHVKTTEAEAFDTAYLAALRGQRKRLRGVASPLVDEVAKALDKLERKSKKPRRR